MLACWDMPMNKTTVASSEEIMAKEIEKFRQYGRQQWGWKDCGVFTI